MLTLRAWIGSAVLVLGAAGDAQSPAPDAACERLATLAITGASIRRAQSVDAGSFPRPAVPVGTADARASPAFCRVTATLQPTSDSDIKMEVWMPASGWNGKFQAVGNGGWAGAISYGAMSQALKEGYATASTDTGHTGNRGTFALGHPEKVVDFGYRAVHEMTTKAKSIIEAFYGRGARISYWNGCSTGGRQAMKAAQRFPEDFDGIIAGAPGLDWTGRAAQALRVARVLETDAAARLLPPHRQLLHTAVLNACDSQDGVSDGLIDDPQRCRFDPAVLQCHDGRVTACLTPAQVNTTRLIYSHPINPKTKRVIPGLAPGSELGWTDLGWTASARATGLDQFRFLVFGDPNWTIQQFNFESDIVRAEETDRETINALDPNLKPYFDRGGRLIQYHGWSDPQISPSSSTQYYSRVIQTLGGGSAVHGAYRLFMAPGMGHCSGGEGPNAFDMVSALEQ